MSHSWRAGRAGMQIDLYKTYRQYQISTELITLQQCVLNFTKVENRSMLANVHNMIILKICSVMSNHEDILIYPLMFSIWDEKMVVTQNLISILIKFC